MKNFEIAIKFTLLAEGIISNDPKDTGRLTIFGISSKWYPEMVAKLKILIDDGKIEIARELAISFYYIEYWQKTGCPELVEKGYLGLAIVVFDTAVNCGVSRAKSFLKNETSWVHYLMKRIVFNTTCETEEVHLRGWTRRIVRLYNYTMDYDKRNTKKKE